MKKNRVKQSLVILGCAVVFIAITNIWYTRWLAPVDRIQYGATFSTVYAEYLGLDWQEVYIEGMDDLGIQAWRIPVYWSEIESVYGEYDWTHLDWMMDQAAERDVDITLAIGLKVPRWPECFLPDWIPEHSQEELDSHAYQFIEATVDRYKSHPSLHRWQVENEPFFPFGECPEPSPERVAWEYGLVRLLDPSHPIQTTTSGEQSLWILSTSRVDILGVSLYREVDTPVGPFVFPYVPLTYSLQRALAEPFVDKVIVSELQAEPWFEGGLYTQEDSLDVLYQAFPVEDLEANVAFAERIGVNEVYFWGVEWWMYLKEQGDDRLWKAGRAILNASYGGAF